MPEPLAEDFAVCVRHASVIHFISETTNCYFTVEVSAGILLFNQSIIRSCQLVCDAAMEYLCLGIEDDHILSYVACWELRLGSHWLL